LWVDHQNIAFNPLAPASAQELFRLPGWGGTAAAWLVCGEITYVARAA